MGGIEEYLPDPPVPPDCDLRDFPGMMLDINRLFGSSFNAKASRNPLAWMLGHKLWYRSWHQVPASSLPDDDDELCYLGELGFDRVSWDNTKQIAMHGWYKCNDGRLYHPVVAEIALRAWERKLRKRYNTECARIKKHNQRHNASIPFPEYNAWISGGCVAVDLSSQRPGDVPKKSRGTTKNVPREKASKREGEGEGEGDSNNTPYGGGAAKRGTRLADDFAMPGDWIDAAIEKGLSRADALREAEKFSNYWQAKSGQAAAKVDWRKTWLNWVLKAVEDRGGGAGAQHKEYLGI